MCCNKVGVKITRQLMVHLMAPLPTLRFLWSIINHRLRLQVAVISSSNLPQSLYQHLYAFLCIICRRNILVDDAIWRNFIVFRALINGNCNNYVTIRDCMHAANILMTVWYYNPLAIILLYKTLFVPLKLAEFCGSRASYLRTRLTATC